MDLHKRCSFFVCVSISAQLTAGVDIVISSETTFLKSTPPPSPTLILDKKNYHLKIQIHLQKSPLLYHSKLLIFLIY